MEVFIAHINEKTKEEQTIKEHSENTAKLCETFAIPELKDVLYAIGLLHDCGKWQESFQKRIHQESKARVEHSTCGAIVAKEKYPDLVATMMEYCIVGHHSGIPDGGKKWDSPDDDSTLYARLKRTFEDYSAYEKELSLSSIDIKKFRQFVVQDCGRDINKLVDKFAFLTRYCFSCLVDADSIDTAEFCETDCARKLESDFERCLNKVNKKLKSFKSETDLQRTRAHLQRQVFEKVNSSAEVYFANMPTGSGKTLASIKFALERAIQSYKKRIIYVIPYNSIINQVAEEFEKLFTGCGEILRHQSTFVYDEQKDYDEDYKEAAKYASENWDTSSIIITTAVQFFESIYSNKRKKLRKLHNTQDSIIVFDEAHLMPLNYLQPCLQAIAYITRYLNSEALFLSATMPNYEQLFKKYAMTDCKTLNLVEDRSQFYHFKKCSFEYIGKVEQEILLNKANEFPASLIIVNKRKTAKKLYQNCKGKKYHLSTYMTSLDRERVMGEIKKELENLYEKYPDGKQVPEEKRVVIISTSLIEAGVDIDMFAVFRELAGLDSILQAGGRCNREGKRKNAKTFIFEIEGEMDKFDEQKDITLGLIKKYEDISSSECIEEYYGRYLFLKQDKIISHTISLNCKDIHSIPFKEYADYFELIDSKTIVSLVIPQNQECREILEVIDYIGIEAVRKLQKYTCSLYRWELEELVKQHVAKSGKNGIYYLTNIDYYNQDIGISFEANDYII